MKISVLVSEGRIFVFNIDTEHCAEVMPDLQLGFILKMLPENLSEEVKWQILNQQGEK